MARSSRSEWAANLELRAGAAMPPARKPRPVQARRLTLGAALYRYGPAILVAIAVLEVAALLV